MTSGPILLIDDEPMIRELYRRMLAGRGYSVFAAASGEDAIAVIHGELPALVISDILMPGMTGFELCDKLRRANEKRMPFLFLSATDNYGVLRDGLAAGGDDFLVKGCDPVMFEERVRFWLRTPLSGLLPGPRAEAVALADARHKDSDQAHVQPIAELGPLREDLKAEALRLAQAAVFEAGTDYLARDAVPLSFLGFLAGAIERLCAGDLAALLRSADLMDAVLAALSPAWSQKARQAFADSEALTGSDLFRAAARMGQRAAERS